MVEISQSFKIEIEAIDADHRRLVEIINEITLAIDEGRAGDCEALVPNFVEFSLQHFERAVALTPRDAGLRFFLGITHISLGQPRQAQRVLVEARQLVAGDEALRQQIEAALESLP